ncbi:MAG: hypothetical protein QOE76_3993 [Frankiales bacterium]|jgi:hypothetical protein|nr:hypothetical protein [Frankiales bacterium]MDX6246270.1 hypothetical protein [Frankiales bacterium]
MVDGGVAVAQRHPVVLVEPVSAVGALALVSCHLLHLSHVAVGSVTCRLQPTHNASTRCFDADVYVKEAAGIGLEQCRQRTWRVTDCVLPAAGAVMLIAHFAS